MPATAWLQAGTPHSPASRKPCHHASQGDRCAIHCRRCSDRHQARPAGPAWQRRGDPAATRPFRHDLSSRYAFAGRRHEDRLRRQASGQPRRCGHRRCPETARCCGSCPPAAWRQPPDNEDPHRAFRHRNEPQARGPTVPAAASPGAAPSAGSESHRRLMEYWWRSGYCRDPEKWRARWESTGYPRRTHLCPSPTESRGSAPRHHREPAHNEGAAPRSDSPSPPARTVRREHRPTSSLPAQPPTGGCQASATSPRAC